MKIRYKKVYKTDHRDHFLKVSIDIFNKVADGMSMAVNDFVYGESSPTIEGIIDCVRTHEDRL